MAIKKLNYITKCAFCERFYNSDTGEVIPDNIVRSLKYKIVAHGICHDCRWGKPEEVHPDILRCAWCKRYYEKNTKVILDAAAIDENQKFSDGICRECYRAASIELEMYRRKSRSQIAINDNFIAVIDNR